MLARLQAAVEGGEVVGGSKVIDVSALTKEQYRCAKVLSSIRAGELDERQLAAVMPSEALPLLP